MKRLIVLGLVIAAPASAEVHCELLLNDPLYEPYYEECVSQNGTAEAQRQRKLNEAAGVLGVLGGYMLHESQEPFYAADPPARSNYPGAVFRTQRVENYMRTCVYDLLNGPMVLTVPVREQCPRRP